MINFLKIKQQNENSYKSYKIFETLKFKSKKKLCNRSKKMELGGEEETFDVVRALTTIR